MPVLLHRQRRFYTSHPKSDTVTTLPGPWPYPAVTYVEYIGGHLYLESPKSDRYVRAYEELGRVALDPQNSAAFVTALAEELT